MADTTAQPTLTNDQRFSVEQARMLIAREPKEIYVAERPGDPADLGVAHAYVLGRLGPYVKDLIAIVDQLTGGGA